MYAGTADANPNPSTDYLAKPIRRCIAKGDVHVKHIKVARSAQPKGSKPGKSGMAALQLLVCYDYYQVYYDNTGAEVGRDFLYSDCPDGGGDTGGSGGGGGASGGGGGGPSAGDGQSELPADAVLVLPPDKPIANFQEYIKCFTTSQGATFTLYVRQPKPGTDDTWAGSIEDPDVGHTFISITQNGITRVFGFYPTSNKAFFDDGPSIMGNNSQDPYSIKVTTAISQTSLINLLTYINSHSSFWYKLQDYNCTDFAIGAATAVGLTLPNATGFCGQGDCKNPGVLGQNMRTMPLPTGATRSLAGTSPANAGGC